MTSKKGTIAKTKAVTTESPPMRATGVTCDAWTALESFRLTDLALLCANQMIIANVVSNETAKTMVNSITNFSCISSLT